MSVVVGVEGDDCAYLAADSLVCAGNACELITEPKIWECEGFGIGVVGDWAHLQAIRYHLEVEAPGEDPEHWIVHLLIPALRKAAADAKVWVGVDKKSRALTVIVAVAGRIFTINDDWALSRSAFGYAAIGSGSSYALGSLACRGARDGQRRAALAVRAAARHCTEVREPVHTLCIQS